MLYYTYVNHQGIAPLGYVGEDRRFHLLKWVPMTMELMIDPRGRLLHFRISTIKVFDRLAKSKFLRSYAVNFCEFLASYPS